MKIFLVERHVQGEFGEVYGIYNSAADAASFIKGLVRDFKDSATEYTISAWSMNPYTKAWTTEECYDCLGVDLFKLYDSDRRFIAEIKL